MTHIPNSLFSHLISPKSSGYYVPLRNTPEKKHYISPLLLTEENICPFTRIVRLQIH